MNYPPLYFGITDRLEGKDEYGNELELGMAMACARSMREDVLEKSQYAEENKKLWHDFSESNPSDKAVIFMLGERTRG